MTRSIVLASAALLVVATASASVEISVPNPKDSVMRVDYTFVATGNGARNFVFPDNGYEFAAGPLHIVSARDYEERELSAELVNPGASYSSQAVKVFYTDPLTRGGTQTRLVVEAKSRGVYLDDAGRWVYRYATSHRLSFIIPDGQAIVYSNQPVTIFERGGHTVLEAVESSSRRDFVFKTVATK